MWIRESAVRAACSCDCQPPTRIGSGEKSRAPHILSWPHTIGMDGIEKAGERVCARGVEIHDPPRTAVIPVPDTWQTCSGTAVTGDEAAAASSWPRLAVLASNHL